MNALVSIKEGEVRASSQDVADAFEKAHKNVVQAIDKLIELAPELTGLNFQPGQMKSPGARGRMVRGYEMDRDGFSLLAMGFTGAKALEWKLKFLDAFRRMEEALSRSLSANDNALAGLHPLLQTPDGREAIGRGMEQVRRMKELKGREAALALWAKLGLPLPDDIDLYLDDGPERALEPPPAPIGEMFAWVAACGVKPNPARVAHWSALWDSYFNWCYANRLTAYRQAKFKWHLHNHFGGDVTLRRGVFALEIGK